MRPRRVATLLVLATLVLTTAACGAQDGGSSDVPVAVTTPTPGAENVATLTLLDLAAELSLVDTEDFSPAEDGTALHVGDTVRTDETGFAQIDHVDGSLTRVDVATTVTVLSLGTAGVPDIDLELDVGRVWNNVRDLGDEGAFRITTDVGVAAVRGTVFLVECLASGTCRVAVFEGEVEFTSTAGVTVTVGAGEVLEVDPDDDDLAATPQPDTLRTDPFRLRNEDLDGGGDGAAPAGDPVLAGEYRATVTLEPPGIQFDTSPGAAEPDSPSVQSVLAQWYAGLPTSEGEAREVAWTIAPDGTVDAGDGPAAGPFRPLGAGQYEAGGQAIDTGIEGCDGTNRVITDHTLLTVAEVVDGLVTRFTGLIVYEAWNPDAPGCQDVRHRSSYSVTGERVGG